MCVNKGRRRNVPVTHIPLSCSAASFEQSQTDLLTNVWVQQQSKLDLKSDMRSVTQTVKCESQK